RESAWFARRIAFRSAPSSRCTRSSARPAPPPAARGPVQERQSSRLSCLSPTRALAGPNGLCDTDCCRVPPDHAGICRNLTVWHPEPLCNFGTRLPLPVHRPLFLIAKLVDLLLRRLELDAELVILSLLYG